MKKCGFDLDNWQNIVADHSEWQSQVSIGVAKWNKQ